MFKTLVLMLCGFSSFSQNTLILEKNQIGQIRTNVDQLTLDSLIMQDSSLLNFSGRKTMYLQINHLLVGKGCILEGSGENGRNGDILPYTNATSARSAPVIRGDTGWNGRQGTDVFITVKDLVLLDTLIIFVPGENGGNGTPAPSLNVINARPGFGNNNSYPGYPGLGGNGGHGGDVMIVYSPSIEESLRRIAIVNHGGRAGLMGDLNPMNLILPPFSPFDQRTLVNDFRYVRKNRRDGTPGKVRMMKLKE